MEFDCRLFCKVCRIFDQFSYLEKLESMVSLFNIVISLFSLKSSIIFFFNFQALGSYVFVVILILQIYEWRCAHSFNNLLIHFCSHKNVFDIDQVRILVIIMISIYDYLLLNFFNLICSSQMFFHHFSIISLFSMYYLHLEQLPTLQARPNLILLYRVLNVTCEKERM